MNEMMMAGRAVSWDGRFTERTMEMRPSPVREFLKFASQPGMISFAGGLPAAELFPAREIQSAANEILSRDAGSALQYSESEGVPGLRDWIAADASRAGVEVARGNVVIFSGAQQALDLIGRVFLNPGDKVLVENPTYLALLAAWRPLGVEFVPVPCDEDGICVEELERLLSLRPKLLYTIPNFQNPSGATLAGGRRERIVELLREAGVGIVEDDAYGALRYEGEATASLFELDARLNTAVSQEGNVIRVGTFSKVLAPGLRVGWVMAPEAVVEKLVLARQAADLHSSTFSQQIVLRLLQDGILDRQVPLLCRAYRVRRDAMLAALGKYFPGGATWTRPKGGMFLMVTLPREMDAGELLAEALKRKVGFVPGADFHADGGGQNTMRLNFSNAGPELIEEGVRKIGECFA